MATEDIWAGEEKSKMDNCPDGEMGSRKQWAVHVG